MIDGPERVHAITCLGTLNFRPSTFSPTAG
jgi:hypothetical protein